MEWHHRNCTRLSFLAQPPCPLLRVPSHLEISGCCQQAQSLLLPGFNLYFLQCCSDFQLFPLSGLFGCWDWSEAYDTQAYQCDSFLHPICPGFGELQPHKYVGAENSLNKLLRRCPGLLTFVCLPVCVYNSYRLFTATWLVLLFPGTWKGCASLCAEVVCEIQMCLAVLGWRQKCRGQLGLCAGMGFRAGG